MADISLNDIQQAQLRLGEIYKSNPTLPHFSSEEELNLYSSQHPETTFPSDLRVNLSVATGFHGVLPAEETPLSEIPNSFKKPRQDSVLGQLIGGAVAAPFSRANYMEQDAEYQNIKQKEVEKWEKDQKQTLEDAKKDLTQKGNVQGLTDEDFLEHAKQNLGKDYTQEARLNFLYGHIDNPDEAEPELERKTRAAFEEKYTGTKRLSRYQKNRDLYNQSPLGRPTNDFELQRLEYELGRARNARSFVMFSKWQKGLQKGQKNSWEMFSNTEQYKHMFQKTGQQFARRYVQNNTSRAEKYAAQAKALGNKAPSFLQDIASAFEQNESSSFIPSLPIEVPSISHEQEREHQSVVPSFKNSSNGVWGRINNARANVQSNIANIRNIGSLAAKAKNVVAVMNPWVLAAIGIILLIFLLIMIIVVILGNNSSETTATEPGGFVDESVCDASLLSGDQIDQQLKAWGFRITSEGGVIVTLAKKQEVYATACLLYQSPKYISLLKATQTTPGNVPVTINYSPQGVAYGPNGDQHPTGRCLGAAFTQDANTIVYCTNDTDKYHRRFFLIHELGHVIEKRNPSFLDKWVSIFTPSSSNLLTSTNCLQLYPPSAWDQPPKGCLNDAMALYVVYPKFNGWAKTNMKDFETNPKWSVYINFLRSDVFGNMSYATPLNNTLVSSASSLVNQLTLACPHTSQGYALVKGRPGIECIYQVQNLQMFKPKTINQLLAVVSNYYTMQCAGFMHAVSIEANADLGGGDAWSYAYRTNIPGYTWINNPGGPAQTLGLQPGDIVVKYYRIPGGNIVSQHIFMIVESPKSNGDTMIAQANGGTGDVEITRISSNLLIGDTKGWLRKNK